MPEHANAKPDALAHASADALVDHGLDYMAAGDPGTALPLLHQALQIDPNHPAATHALLRALEDSGHLQEALAVARNLTEREPDDPLAFTRLSILLQRTGDVPGAEAASARARILDWKRQLQSSSQTETE